MLGLKPFQVTFNKVINARSQGSCDQTHYVTDDVESVSDHRRLSSMSLDIGTGFVNRLGLC